MKKKIILMLFALGALSVQAFAVSKKVLNENVSEEFKVTKNSTNANPALKVTKQIELNGGSVLKIIGNIKEKATDYILGLDHKEGNFGTKGILIKEDGNLDINIKLKDSEKGYPSYSLVGMQTYSPKKKFEIEKNGNLNIVVHSNKPLVKQSKINAPHKDNKDLFHQLYYTSVGTRLGMDLISKGNINIESTGWGMMGQRLKEPKNIDFENGSKTNIKAGLIGIYFPKDGTTVNFKEGSYTKLISGIYGLVARKAVFESGSKIDAYGKYGLGNFEYKGAGDKYFFKKGSEVNILANHSALYGISLQEGSAKVNAKAKNILHTVDTRKGATQTLDTFTFDNGSILEGNIVESWSSKIKLDEGAKLFVNDEIDTNLIAKGDIYIGPRTAYENVENKVYKEEVKKQLGDVDAVVGASVILMGEHSKVNLDDLKTDELDDHYGKPRDIHPFPEVDPNKYYTVRFNDYNYNSDDRKIKVNFDNAKIHLRLGKEKDGRINDKLFFSKISTIEENSKAKVKVHVGKGFNPDKAREVKFIESAKRSAKDLAEAKIFNFEDIKIGGAIYKYDLANSKFRDTGIITADGKESIAATRNNFAWYRNINSEVFGKVFVKNDSEKRNNFWLLSSNINLKNKDTKDKFKQSNYYAGYDFNVIPKLRVGLFAGKSNGLNKSDSYGLYMVKDFDKFYIGTAFKKSEMKIGNKKLSHNDFVVAAGHKWEADNFFAENKITLVRGKMPEYTTTKNDLDTKREKFNYLDGELSTKLGYKYSNLSLFTEANLIKNLWGEQKIVWDEGVERELKQDGIDTTVSLGGEYKIYNHKFDVKLSKKWNKHYRSNVGVTFGYSYKF